MNDLASTMSDLQISVGNSYKSVHPSEAKLDRNDRYRKDHDWTLYVDVIAGCPDDIKDVTFDLGPSFQPQKYVSSCPVPVKSDGGGPQKWRFCTRQQSYGSVAAEVMVQAADGSTKSITHRVALGTGGASQELRAFDHQLKKCPLPRNPMSGVQRFGIGLELFSNPGVGLADIAGRIPTDFGDVRVDTFGGGQASSSSSSSSSSTTSSSVSSSSDCWNIRFVPDKDASALGCNRFELESRVLQGGRGIKEVANVANALSSGVQTRLGRGISMGFHVCIDVDGYSLKKLIKICQNFIKYEDVMDSFMPPSRRNECKYFRSNRASVPGSTNKQRHDFLGKCTSILELANAMNGGGMKYYKLNLQNLISIHSLHSRRTLEFRQHPSALDGDKIGAWVCFCTAFVRNSARLAPPSTFQKGRPVEFQCTCLFHFVVKDRALQKFLKLQWNKVCCDVGDGGCDASCDMRRIPKLTIKEAKFKDAVPESKTHPGNGNILWLRTYHDQINGKNNDSAPMNSEFRRKIFSEVNERGGKFLHKYKNNWYDIIPNFVRRLNNINDVRVGGTKWTGPILPEIERQKVIYQSLPIHNRKDKAKIIENISCKFHFMMQFFDTGYWYHVPSIQAHHRISQRMREKNKKRKNTTEAGGTCKQICVAAEQNRPLSPFQSSIFDFEKKSDADSLKDIDSLADVDPLEDVDFLQFENVEL